MQAKELWKARGTTGILPVLLLLGAAAALLWAPVANGYPFLYYDSGSYIESSYTLEVANSRPLGYGLFIRLTRLRGSLWLVVLVQALMTSFLMFRAARTV